MNGDIQLSNFCDVAFIHRVARAPIIVVYESPIDYPGKYVARLWNMDKKTRFVIVRDYIGEIHAVIPEHMRRISRSAGEDPVIVESWI